jgi:hypothetical protein
MIIKPTVTPADSSPLSSGNVSLGQARKGKSLRSFAKFCINLYANAYLVCCLSQFENTF